MSYYHVLISFIDCTVSVDEYYSVLLVACCYITQFDFNWCYVFHNYLQVWKHLTLIWRSKRWLWRATCSPTLSSRLFLRPGRRLPSGKRKNQHQQNQIRSPPKLWLLLKISVTCSLRGSRSVFNELQLGEFTMNIIRIVRCVLQYFTLKL